MTLTKWYRPQVSPFRQLSSLQDQLDRLFDAPWSLANGQSIGGDWVPALDVIEDKDNFVVKLEAPGMSKDAIDVSFHDGVLSISGERKEEEKREEGQIYRAERFFGRFQRSVTLPAKVNAEKVNASYKDGILTITLPKAEEAKPKQITINVK